MKRSIGTKITLITTTLLLVMSCFFVFISASVEKRIYSDNLSDFCAETANKLNFYLYDHGIEKPEELFEHIDNINLILQNCCTLENVKYTYIYVPSEDEQSKYYIALCDKDGPVSVTAEDGSIRKSGEIADSPLNDNQKKVWHGEVENTYFTVNNQFGYAYTFTASLYNANSQRIAILCADISVDDFYSNLLASAKNEIILFFVLIVAFAICQHIILERILYKPLSKTAELISDFMVDGNRELSLPKTTTREFESIKVAFEKLQKNADEHISQIENLTKEKAEMQAQISVAGEIQKTILPSSFYSSDNFEIQAMLKSAVNVSGDFYDYYTYSNGNTMIAIADVSGKGISAAMFMSKVFLLLRVYLYLTNDVCETLKQINNELIVDNKNKLFVTLFLGVYNDNTKTLTYSNAGHNIPYLLSDRLVALDGSRGLLLGLFENEEYEKGEIVLSENDTVFLYTDGVNEAQNEKKEFFTTERLEKILEKSNDNVISNVYSEIEKFVGDAVQTDDITMLTLSASNRTVKFPAKLSSFGQIREKCFEVIGEDRKSKIEFLEILTALEEAFVNICNYAYDGDEGEVEFNASYLGTEFVCTLSDSGKEFNPLSFASESHSQNSADNLIIGGQGIHLIKSMTDAVDYVYENGCNKLKLTKIIK